MGGAEGKKTQKFTTLFLQILVSLKLTQSKKKKKKEHPDPTNAQNKRKPKLSLECKGAISPIRTLYYATVRQAASTSSQAALFLPRNNSLSPGLFS